MDREIRSRQGRGGGVAIDNAKIPWTMTEYDWLEFYDKMVYR